jgi:spore germination protein YaaH
MNKILHLFFAAMTISVFGYGQSSMQEQKKYFDNYHYTNDEDWDKLRADGNHLLPSEKKQLPQTTSTCTLNKRVFGWHPYWQGTTYTNYKWNLLSDFCYFDYEISSTTGQNTNSSFVWRTSAAVTAAKANGSNIHFCASLFSGFSTFFGSATAQQAFIDSTKALLVARGAKGVNLDFEGMGASSKAPFTAFVQNLSSQIKAVNPNYEVSIALYSVDWNAVFDIPNLTPSVDLFIIMGYDYYYSGSTTAGPESPLYNFQTGYNYTCVSSIDYYLKQGVPNSKLLLGLPYYGRDWSTNSNAIPSGTTGASSNTRLFSTVKTNTSGNYTAANYNWDASSFNPAYIYQSAGVWYQCWIDDARSLGYKLDVINERNIGGMGIWALGYDDGYNDYWNEIQTKLSSCTTVPCSDTIYDMGGPNRNYYSNETYSFTISPTGSSKVKLTFTQFNVETGFDSLWLYDGSSITAPLLGKYTGTVTPTPVTSTGNALTVRFKSDGATVTPGFTAIWQCFSTPPDTTKPTTSITVPVGWITQNFTATYTDIDNSGGSGIEKKFYNVAANNGTEWRSNNKNGFFRDDFDAAINTDWTQKVGAFTISSQHLEQTNQTYSNTNIYAPLTQILSNRYVYSWQGNITGAGTSRRAGLHFFCDAPDSVNRGNSYFIWYRVDQSAVEIYRTSYSAGSNVFTLVKSIPQTISAGTWYNNTVTYDRITGEIAIWINSKYIGSYTDASPISSGAYVSFRSGNCDYAVDNFKVYRSRTSSTNISVGSGSTNDIQFQNTSPANYAASISSLVKDSAYNLSTVSTKTLNVDWSKPIVSTSINDGTTADIDTVYTTTQLSSNWAAATDPNSSIANYLYAIGTTQGAQNMVAWTSNNTTSVTKTGLNLTVGQYYYFSVKAVDGAGLICDSINSDGVIVLAGSTGINKLVGNNNMLVYPNPNNGNFTIKISDILKEVSVNVYNSIGELVLHNNITPNQKEIHMSDLSEGVYFVTILSEGIKISTQRIVVLK